MIQISSSMLLGIFMRKKLILLLAAFMLLAFTACGGSSLVGRWEATHVQLEFDGESFSEDVPEGEMFIEFFSDGNGTMTEGRNTETFTWSSNRGRLTITQWGDAETGDYNISRSTLTLTTEESDFTSTVTFRRVN